MIKLSNLIDHLSMAGENWEKQIFRSGWQPNWIRHSLSSNSVSHMVLSKVWSRRLYWGYTNWGIPAERRSCVFKKSKVQVRRVDFT